ncbi:MAG: DUF1501 domain-containing protein [Fuerstiella sp.]|nr:DUF1501 domain-containing protein [Fuerstiella sp.]
MLRILGSRRALCGGLTRRDSLHVGGLATLGLGLSDLLKAQDTPALADPSSGFGRAKSCILLLPYGSPPQHETFDPKPNAPVETRGEFNPVATSVPGLQICEGLPKISRVMDRVSVIRSMTHPYPLHCTAYVTSGIPDYSPALETRPRDPQLWPYIGSVVDYVDERTTGKAPNVPRNIAIPWKMNSRGGEAASVQAGPYATFLGSAYDPVLTNFSAKGTREIIKQRPFGVEHKVRDPYAGIDPAAQFEIAGIGESNNITLDRLNRRRNLLDQLSDATKDMENKRSVVNLNRYRQMAWSLLSSPRIRDALNIQAESSNLRDSYGMTLFGQSCLLARRLVDAGSRFVTVFWDEYAYLNTDWDTHWNQTPRLKGWLWPGFDAAFSGLILDLERRGTLDETLVIWMSEHGRTPRFNAEGGRDHWSRVYSIALAGAGIPRGQVIGSSDHLGGDVHDNPVSPKDILATIYHLLGIDAKTIIHDGLGRPLPIAGTGTVRNELI